MVKKLNMKPTASVMYASLVIASINGYGAEIPSGTPEAQTISHEGYIPPLGEIMGLSQMRHSKLWFAGNAKNWSLAKYELGEIKEGFEDLGKYHPVFDELPIGSMAGVILDQPINDIHNAIESKNRKKFRVSFNSLTNACNACHQAARRGFIKILRPRTSPYSNQKFAIEAGQ
ncbi:MAG: hypothetical protein WA632_12245 [Gallionella sp.]